MNDCYTNEYATHHAGCQCHEDAWERRIEACMMHLGALQGMLTGIAHSLGDTGKTHWANHIIERLADLDDIHGSTWRDAP
jgi:hypothetical protein